MRIAGHVSTQRDRHAGTLSAMQPDESSGYRIEPEPSGPSHPYGENAPAYASPPAYGPPPGYYYRYGYGYRGGWGRPYWRGHGYGYGGRPGWQHNPRYRRR